MIEVLKRYQALLDAGLSAQEVLRLDAQRENEQHDGRYTQCPECGALHPYHGDALAFCQCGYCRHAVATSSEAGKFCDHCGVEDPEHVLMTPAHHVVHDEKPAIAVAAKKR